MIAPLGWAALVRRGRQGRQRLDPAITSWLIFQPPPVLPAQTAVSIWVVFQMWI
jgi:hypothetical protein